jgi:hypothetical protein
MSKLPGDKCKLLYQNRELKVAVRVDKGSKQKGHVTMTLATLGMCSLLKERNQMFPKKIK